MTKQEANQLYDSFPASGQDMSRSEFIRRAVAATDPKQMREDLRSIMRGKRERIKIDRALGE